MAKDVDNEGLAQIIIYALVGEEVPHVEEIAGMLAIESGDDLAGAIW